MFGRTRWLLWARQMLAGSVVLLTVGVQADDAGKELYNTQCAHCHTLDPAAPAIVGPHLSNLNGRQAASVDNYPRNSAALSARGADGLSWDAESLNDFLTSPQTSVPGTVMGFPGLASAEDRAALVAFLLSDGLMETAAAPEVDPEVARILALEADGAYGEYLAGECLTCHSSDTAQGGVPPIKSLPRSYFVQALLEYRNGMRDNEVMKLMAANAGDEELAALSAFFAPME